MDPIKTGKFFALLRKEKGLTQEELGARLGVSAKTVSRWENGSVSPDVDALLSLGRELGADIRELIAGERLPSDGAEDSKTAEGTEQPTEPRRSPFTRREAEAYWKRKWQREHRGAMALVYVLTAALFIFGGIAFRAFATAVCLLIPVLVTEAVVFYNKKMIYVENCLYAVDTVYAEDPALPKTREAKAGYFFAAAALYALNGIIWAVNFFRDFGRDAAADIAHGITALCFCTAAAFMLLAGLRAKRKEK